MLRRAALRRDEDEVVAALTEDERELAQLTGLASLGVQHQAGRAVPEVADLAVGLLVLRDVVVTEQRVVACCGLGHGGCSSGYRAARTVRGGTRGGDRVDCMVPTPDALSFGVTAPAPTRAVDAAGRTWFLAHLATLAAAVPVLVWINRDQWFQGDEWQVITYNGLGSNPTRLGIFAPHFEHWSTLGVLAYKALYGVFAMRSYWPYVAVLIVVILAVAHMTWRLLLRIGVVPAYSDRGRRTHDDRRSRLGEPLHRLADHDPRPGGARLRRPAGDAGTGSVAAT